MATEESNIVQKCRLRGGEMGGRLFRNNRGLFVTIDSINRIKSAAIQFGVKGVLELIKSNTLRKVRAGLEAPGSSDLIGWQPIVITPAMVGKKLAVFCAIEVKKDARSYATKEQQVFVQNVNDAGGIAGVVRSEDELQALVQQRTNTLN